ncbi:secreted RxLR effector protein 78-like [Nicotiana tabacum]|uniref:Secreted RxLR effector protein 78-like n=1 Tax=Nicotiana tabacum TaxID=4097 RepID=A0AC58UHV7_TOBAC
MGRKEISPRCMIKIDMQKAYDSHEWVFLEQVLIGLNFPKTFVKWIMTCVQTISYSIVVNGKATTTFATKRGVRQEDPLSHYIFVIAMEYLNRNGIPYQAAEDSEEYAKLNLVQLGFADDLLLFCRGDVISAKLLKSCKRWAFKLVHCPLDT